MDSPQPQSSAKSPTSTTKWVVLIIILIIAGLGAFLLWRDETRYENKNTVNTSPNSNQSVRPSAEIYVDPATQEKVYTYDRPEFSIRFPSGWFFTEPQKDHPDYNSLLLIAANENADSPLSLQDSSTGLVVYLTAIPGLKTAEEYFTENPAKPIDIPSARVTQSRVSIEDHVYEQRIVNSLGISDWEGTYAVEYVRETDEGIIVITFIAASESSIGSNESVISAMLGSAT